MNYIDRQVPTPPARRRTDSGGRATPPPIRVLIVDDDASFLRYMEVLVSRLGCDVRTAIDGENAWRQLAATEFDLLLSDLEMPRMDGLALIRHVRTAEVNGHIFAVMMTNHDRSESRVAALTSGFDDFLPKTCTEVEVVARIAAARRMVARQRALYDEAEVWRAIALRDELTGVGSRRAFLGEARRVLAAGGEIGVALFDLDSFKLVNDRFGHLAGDRILRDAGALFLASIRSDDLIARFGGDEFVLLMEAVSAGQVRAVVERLTDGIRALSWTFDGEAISIGMTAGVAHSTLMTPASVEQLIEAADQELYTKKWLRTHPSPVPLLVYEIPTEIETPTRKPPPRPGDEAKARR